MANRLDELAVQPLICMYGRMGCYISGIRAKVWVLGTVIVKWKREIKVKIQK